MKKKILAILLTLIMVLQIAAPAFTVADGDPEPTYVAQINNGAKYETLAEAFAAVENGQTITLLGDLTQDDGVKFNKLGVSATLDLDGHTFTVNEGSNINNRAIRIDAGTLRVTSGRIVAAGSGTTSSDGAGCYGAFRVEADGKLIANDLTLTNSRPYGLNVKVLGGEAELTNVTIQSSYGGGIEVTESKLGTHSKAGKATLTNCNFTQQNYSEHCSTAVAVSGGSELIVNSGSYIGEYAMYVFSSGGVIKVNGGTFTGRGNNNRAAIVAEIDLNSYSGYTGGLEIKGGSVTGAFRITSPAYMSITGGTFNVDPSDWVADGYEAVAQGTSPETWRVQLEPVVLPKATVSAFTASAATAYLGYEASDIIPFYPGLSATELNGEPIAIRLFTSDTNESEATSAFFEDWYADFAVSFNKAITAYGITLDDTTYTTAPVIPIGYYADFGNYVVGLAIDKNLSAGEDYWLLADGMGLFDNSKSEYPYIRDTVENFFCGAVLIDDAFLEGNPRYSEAIQAYEGLNQFADGLKMTVKLRIYSPEDVSSEDIAKLEASGYTLNEFTRGGSTRYYIDIQSDTFDIIPTIYVAQIGDVKYTSFEEAIAAANADTNATADNPVVVKLLANVDVSAPIMISNHVTLDGGNHTITTTANRGIRVDKSGVSVTVKDLTITGSGMERAIQVDSDKDNVKLTIYNVTATATTYTVNICGSVDNLTLAITNSTLTGWGVVNLWGNNGTVTISGSTLSGINDKGYNAEGWNNFGTIIVEGDTTGQTTEHASAYNISISNTAISATQTTGNKQFALLYNNPSTSNNMTLTNCTITLGEKCSFWLNKSADGSGKSTTKIKGSYMTGTINLPQLPDGFTYVDVAEGYKQIVVSPTPVAQIGSVKYETLEGAYAAAKAGDTIKLLADITYGEDREVPVWSKAVNLDLDGHTLTTNSTVSKDASNNGYKAAAICYSIPAASAANVTVSNGTIVTAYGAGVYADDPGLTLTLENLTITAGTVGQQTTTEYTSAVRITGGAKVIIDSGSYSGYNAIAVSNSGGEFEINGGKFKGNLFISSSCDSGKTQKITITGGIFSSDPSAYVATGHAALDNFDNATSAAYPYMVAKVESTVNDTTSTTNEHVAVQEITYTDSTGNEATAVAVTDKSGKTEVVVTTSEVHETVTTSETAKASDYVEVAQVLANVIETEHVDVADVTSINMELSLSKTDKTDSNNDATATTILSAVGEVEGTKKVFELHPVATVTTTTKSGTPIDPITYAVSNSELAKNATFTTKLSFGPDAKYKKVTLTHYASDGTVKNTWVAMADKEGNVTITLSSFSYVLGVVEESNFTPVTAELTAWRSTNYISNVYLNMQDQLYFTVQFHVSEVLDNTEWYLRFYFGNGSMSDITANEFKKDLNHNDLKTALATGNNYTCNVNKGEGDYEHFYEIRQSVWANEMSKVVTVVLYNGYGEKQTLYVQRTENFATMNSDGTFTASTNSYLTELAGKPNWTATANALKAYGAAAAVQTWN